MKGKLWVPWFLLSMVLALPAFAEDKPILSWSRVALSAGIDYAFYGTPGSGSYLTKQLKDEWKPGLFAAYVLAAPREAQAGPIVTLAGAARYGLEAKQNEFTLGVRIGLKPAK